MPRSKSSAAQLAQALEESERPIYVVNDQRRIVFCNAACAAWVGVAAEELVGKQCAYHSQPNPALAIESAAGLCPPPEAFSGHSQRATVHANSPDGASRARLGEFLSLSDGADASAPVLAILEAADYEVTEADGSADATAELHERLRQFRRQQAARYKLDSLVGASPVMERVRAQVALAASGRANILIVGPIGAGKSHIAQAIHHRRAAGSAAAMTPLDCQALSTELFTSTLAALAQRIARQTATSSDPATAPGVSAAHDSLRPDTILLDHVDQLAPEAQAEVARLAVAGSLAGRLIATAREPLAALVAAGKFRADLASALSTLVIELPPLAARLGDLPLLAQAMLEEINAEGGKQLSRFAPDALELLAGHAWPRNLEELLLVIRESHHAAATHEVLARDLPKRLHLAGEAALHPRRGEEPIDLEEFLGRVEKELIERALARAKGNKSKAAKLLGLTRPRLYRRMINLGLEQPKFGEIEPEAG